jgi:hypothetical protein
MGPSEGGAAFRVHDSQHMDGGLSLSKSDKSDSNHSERAHGSCTALALLPKQAAAVLDSKEPVDGQVTPPRTPQPAGPAGRAEPGGGPAGPAGAGPPAAPLPQHSAPPHGATAPANGPHSPVVFVRGSGHLEAGSAPTHRSIHRVRSLMDPRAPGVSMHGEEAFRRQGLSELIFFAAVGDVARCRKVAEKYKLEVRPCQRRWLGGTVLMVVVVVTLARNLQFAGFQILGFVKQPPLCRTPILWEMASRLGPSGSVARPG